MYTNASQIFDKWQCNVKGYCENECRGFFQVFILCDLRKRLSRLSAERWIFFANTKAISPSFFLDFVSTSLLYNEAFHLKILLIDLNLHVYIWKEFPTRKLKEISTYTKKSTCLLTFCTSISCCTVLIYHFKENI